MWHEHETRLTLPRPLEQVFKFFAEASNLERITPPELKFQILTRLPLQLQAGSVIDYRLALFGVPFKWRTRIVHWDPPHIFVDEQERGPYRNWVHSHTFSQTGDGTAITDRVRFRLPLPPLGELAYPLVRRQVERIFRYREARIQTLLATQTRS